MTAESADLAIAVSRLQRLERRNRWAILIVLLLSLCAWGYMWFERQKSRPETDEVVAAQRIELIDREGTRHGMLSTSRTGPLLIIHEGGSKVELQIGKAGSTAMVLTDPAGMLRASISNGKPGSILQLSDENGKIRAFLGSTNDGPNLSLSDEDGKTRLKLSVKKDGSHLEFFDADGKLVSTKP